MSETGIQAYGVHLPSLRLERAAIADAHAWALPALRGLGKGQRTMANWDEDSITMAVEAVRGCVANSNAPAVLTFASTTPVFADMQNASLVAAGANLGNRLRSQDMSGSLRGGTSALAGALHSSDVQIVVASDRRTARPGSVQEMQYGAGAVALQVGPDKPIARLLASASNSELFVDHFRPEGEAFDYQWEERWVRDEGYLKLLPPVIAKVLEEGGCNAEEVKHFCMASPQRGLGGAVTPKAGLNPEALVDDQSAVCGDVGIAQPLLMLALALEQAKAGEKILVLGFGGAATRCCWKPPST